MNSQAFLAYHPKSRSEANQLYLALSEPLRKAGVMLSLYSTADEACGLPLQPGDRTTPAIIAMVGSDGSVPWDADATITRATASREALIVPTLIDGAPEVEIPAPIRLRSVLAFELSLSDGASLARLISTLPRLERSVGGLNRSLPEEVANSLFESTIRFYEENGQEFIDAHEQDIPSALRHQVLSFLSRVDDRCLRSTGQARILDAGCGPGHHTRFFAKHGFRAIGIDCCSRFIQHAKAVSEEACSFIKGDIRQLDLHFPASKFDGIWANASCLHMTRDAVARILDHFRELLRPNGVLGISFQLGMSTLQREGRFFERYDSDEPAEMLRKRGFNVIEALGDTTTKSSTGRTRVKRWISFLAFPK